MLFELIKHYRSTVQGMSAGLPFQDKDVELIDATDLQQASVIAKSSVDRSIHASFHTETVLVGARLVEQGKGVFARYVTYRMPPELKERHPWLFDVRASDWFIRKYGFRECYV